MKPNFIGIGVQKCATTWLYDVLKEHPQISLSPKKEVDFFSYYYGFGFEWYERNFSANDESKLHGEISPSYFDLTDVPQRIANYDPLMKLILVLRDPIKRAISNHKHEIRLGHLTGEDLSFECGLRNNPEYIEQGLYAKHIDNWRRHFGAEQMLIIMFDDVINYPLVVARETYEFLGVNDASASLNLHRGSNESYFLRNRGIDATKNKARALFARMKLEPLWRAAGTLGARRFYRALNRTDKLKQFPEPDARTLTDLREIFRDDVRKLELLINRDLGHWLQ